MALLIFDRNLIPMPYPVITHILSISVSQKCGSLWPGRRSLRQKNLKKIAKTFTSGNRPTSTKFSINYQTKNQNYPYWITGSEKLVYVPGNGQIAYFCTFQSRASGCLVTCQANISVKQTYYLKLRSMCQDMPRMQDFAPFTPRTPTVRTTS